MSAFNGNYKGFCSIEEAREKHVEQLGTSACGVTATVNILLLLDIVQKEDLSKIQYDKCILRTRANDAPLPQYLYSRHHAGCTGEELVKSVQILLQQNNFPEDLIESEFLTYDTIISQHNSLMDCLLSKFLEGWIAIATMNLQLIGNDAWHHQVIFGVDEDRKAVFAMNPFEVIPLVYITKFLSTESVLIVRREDIISRLDRPGEDLTIYDQDHWKDFNIPQQINDIQQDPDIDFVIIPAAYKGGISFFRRKL